MVEKLTLPLALLRQARTHGQTDFHLKLTHVTNDLKTFYLKLKDLTFSPITTQSHVHFTDSSTGSQ